MTVAGATTVLPTGDRHFEIVLRNALHEQLVAWHAKAGRAQEWYDDPAEVLDDRFHTDIKEARRRLAGKVETPGKVIAELGFGFWRYLLDKRHQTTLWAPALRHAFPKLIPQRRFDAYGPVAELNRLRNRIAHHERIYHLDLPLLHEDLLRVTGFVDPAIPGWRA